MSAIVRVYSHSSLMPAPKASSGGYLSTDSVSQLKQPYLQGERLTVDTITSAASSPNTAPDGTKLLFVQVQYGNTVHFEVTPENQTVRPVTNASPTLSGEALFEFGPRWTMAFLQSTE